MFISDSNLVQNIIFVFKDNTAHYGGGKLEKGSIMGDQTGWLRPNGPLLWALHGGARQCDCLLTHCRLVSTAEDLLFTWTHPMADGRQLTPVLLNCLYSVWVNTGRVQQSLVALCLRETAAPVDRIFNLFCVSLFLFLAVLWSVIKLVGWLLYSRGWLFLQTY